MENKNLPCATPWIDFATESTQSFYNMLIVKGSDEPTMFVNVHDIVFNKDQGSSLTTKVSILYKSNKKSRHYFNELTFKHSEGTYTTKTMEEAFCIQELY